MKKFIKNLLLQIIPVMIGVYLGFAANNFGEAQQLKKRTTIYQKMLINEIEQNLKEIKKVRPYHIELSKSFSKILNSDQMKKDFADYEMKGLRPGFVNDSAYDTGIQTGIIQEFDLEMIQHLNRLYNLQNKYNSFNNDMLRSFLGSTFPETEKEIRSMLISANMNLNDVFHFESELDEFYTFLLAKLKAKE